MKVLHYVARFSVQSETFIYDQIKAIKHQGWESTIITSRRENEVQRPFNEVKVIPLRLCINWRVNQKIAFGIGFEKLKWLINYRQWNKSLVSIAPDIVHCHMGNAAKTWLHVREKLNKNIPTIISLHGSDVTMEPDIKVDYKNWLCSAALLPNVFWTVPSHFLKNKAQLQFNIPENKVMVVNNGVSSLFLDQKSSSLVRNKQSFKILSIGRFIGCKGHQYLITGFANFLTDYPNSQLTLIGNGPLIESVIEQAKRLNVFANINVVRSASHSEVANLMGEHDIYVQPSIKDKNTNQEESFGVAALEAISSGLPIIVTKCGGLPEVVNSIPPQYARIVPQEDGTAIGVALRNMCSEYCRIPSKITSKIKHEFSIESKAREVISLYERALSL